MCSTLCYYEFPFIAVWLLHICPLESSLALLIALKFPALAQYKMCVLTQPRLSGGEELDIFLSELRLTAVLRTSGVKDKAVFRHDAVRAIATPFDICFVWGGSRLAAHRVGQRVTRLCVVLACCVEVQPDLCPQVALGQVMLHIDCAYSAVYYSFACYFSICKRKSRSFLHITS